MARVADSTSSTEGARHGGARAGARVELGRVVAAHGLRGELRVRAEGDLENLLHVPTVRLVLASGEEEERSEEFEVAGARPGRSGECRLRLAGLADRDTAESWRGARLLARAGDLIALSPGEFYAFELVGCEVHRRDGGRVGRVREIWETGASDLLVIEDADGRDQLVPAVEPLLSQVDLAARRIVIDAPPGLLSSGTESGERE